VTPLSAVLITRDEEHNLPAALRSLAFCDEMVVLDSGSADRTRELAAAAGARVELGTPWPGFLEQRSRATALARHDWVLALDADERVTPALRDEIEGLRQRGFDRAGYRIPRVAHYLGRWIRGTDWYPDTQLRLFDRRQGRWTGAHVHESVSVDGPVGRLRGELEHYPYRNLAEHLQTIDRYTTLWARQSREAGRRARPLETLLTPSWTFFRSYLLRGGFRLGWPGFAVSALGAHYTFVKLAKLRESERAPEPSE
jgi:glycosyltransferase involved in cell wall biosynthesis